MPPKENGLLLVSVVVVACFVLIMFLSVASTGAFSQSPLTVTCKDVTGDPLHAEISAADAVWNSLPPEVQTKLTLSVVRLTVSQQCAVGPDQSMQQIRDDLVQSQEGQPGE